MKKFLAMILLLTGTVQAAQLDSRFLQDSAVTKIKIASNAVGTTAILLENNAPFRAYGPASVEMDLFKLDNSNIFQMIQWPYLPAGSPLSAKSAADKSYVDTQISTNVKTSFEEIITLTGTNITNQYVDALQNCVLASVLLSVNGVWGIDTLDYTLSTVASKTRISFVATSGWGTGSGQALVAGDAIYLHCQY